MTLDFGPAFKEAIKDALLEVMQELRASLTVIAERATEQPRMEMLGVEDVVKVCNGNVPDPFLLLMEEVRNEIRALTATRAIQPGALTLTVEAAQQRLACSRTRVFDLLKDGTLKRAKKVGRAIMITIESVDRALLPSRKVRKRRTGLPADFKLEDVPL